MFLVAALIAVSLTSCREELASTEGTDKPFSVYGVISPQLDTQSVVVYPVEQFPTLGTAEPLGAEVTSIDLQTGRRMTWQDTVVVEPNGQYSHIYWAPFRAEFGHRYRIEVVRASDGAHSFAEVRVPEPVSIHVADDSNARAVQLIIEGDSLSALNSEIEYVLGDIFPTCTILRNRFSYQGRERAVEEGWRVEINMVENRFELLFNCGGITTFPRPYCPPGYVPLRSIDLHVVIGDTSWSPPGGVLDSDVVSQPTAMTNVQNGFGFIGAGYRTVESFFPSAEALEEACFVYED